MKPVIIITIVFVLLIPLSVFAQEESLSELTARLDAENLQKAQEAGSIVEPSLNVPQQESFKKIDCPSGYVTKALSGGGLICVNKITGQKLDNSTMINLDNTVGYIIIGVIVVIIIIVGIAKASSKESEPDALPRRGWTDSQHKQVLDRQDGKCAMCGEHSSTFQFDHKDDNHNNDDLDNCQALCPNCHDRKSRGLD